MALVVAADGTLGGSARLAGALGLAALPPRWMGLFGEGAPFAADAAATWSGRLADAAAGGSFSAIAAARRLGALLPDRRWPGAARLWRPRRSALVHRRHRGRGGRRGPRRPAGAPLGRARRFVRPDRGRALPDVAPGPRSEARHGQRRLCPGGGGRGRGRRDPRRHRADRRCRRARTGSRRRAGPRPAGGGVPQRSGHRLRRAADDAGRRSAAGAGRSRRLCDRRRGSGAGARRPQPLRPGAARHARPIVRRGRPVRPGPRPDLLQPALRPALLADRGIPRRPAGIRPGDRRHARCRQSARGARLSGLEGGAPGLVHLRPRGRGGGLAAAATASICASSPSRFPTAAC